MGDAARVAYANLGAEEGLGEVAADARGSLLSLAHHFRALVQRPPWRALEAADGLVAWINTADAAAAAARRGLAVWGAPVDVVRRVHDKGFAMSTALALGLLDDDLASTITVFDPDELTVEAIEAALARWPAWARAAATLKPRWGTSGRGRVPVRNAVLDERTHNGLAGLRARGGAVLEPWLTRVDDLSSQWFVGPGGEVRLLGCTKMLTRPSGVWLGCDFVVDDDGGGSGTPWDAALIAGARPLVEAAGAAGFMGFCGVDALTWRHQGTVRLRSVVELNARFTGGTAALGTHDGKRGRAIFRL
jgi:hypothetical protein